MAVVKQKRDRDFRDCSITDNDLLSAGFYIAGVPDFGNTWIRSTMIDDYTQQIVHVWNGGRGIMRFSLYYQEYGGTPVNLGTGHIENSEDLQALIDLHEEEVKKMLDKVD